MCPPLLFTGGERSPHKQRCNWILWEACYRAATAVGRRTRKRQHL